MCLENSEQLHCVRKGVMFADPTQTLWLSKRSEERPEVWHVYRFITDITSFHNCVEVEKNGDEQSRGSIVSADFQPPTANKANKARTSHHQRQKK